MTFRAVVGTNQYFAVEADRPLSVAGSAEDILDGSTVTFTDSGAIERWDQVVGAWVDSPSGIGTDDSGSVPVGTSKEISQTGVSKDRLFVGDPTTGEKFTWAEGLGPVTILMKVVAIETTTDEDPKPAVKVTYDAESALVAAQNLVMTGSETGSTQHEFIEYGDGWVRQDFFNPLQQLDFATAYGVVAEFRVKGV